MTDVSTDRRATGPTGSSPTTRLAVFAESAYPSTVASVRVRVSNFVPFLDPLGVALDYAPALRRPEYEVLASSGRISRKAATLGWATARAVLRRRPEHDLLLVHRLRILNPLPGFDPPRHLDVYDIDDPLFAPFTAGGVNQRFRWAKQEARRCVECLRRTRLVLAGNAYLARRAQQYATRVEVLPSCVDPTIQPLHPHHDGRTVTVGWIGSPTTTPYLRDVLPVFERINASSTTARLVLVGADRSINAPWIEHRPWSRETEAADLASFDIGIMPQPDDEWARGKCGYKVLQYFAAGVPAIASPVGVAREMIGTERGLMADTEAEWRRALTDLIEDPDRRAEQGAAARAFVERSYSYQRWAPELAQMLRSVAG